MLAPTLSNLSSPNTHEFSSSSRRELVEAVLSYEILKGYLWNRVMSVPCSIPLGESRKQDRIRAGTGPGRTVVLTRKQENRERSGDQATL